jgi:hypothetical protein
MFARKQDDSKDRDSEVEALRGANALIYVRPSNIALIDRRVLKSYNFSSNTYELGSTLQLISNSGGDSIWGPSSYLRLEYTASADLDFGQGSILNLFKSIRWTHRSGEILEFTDNVNVLMNLKRYWAYSRDDRIKLDGLLGTVPTAAFSNKPGNGVHVVCIPLSLMCGLFDNKSQYIPASLLAGAKLELELAPLSVITTTLKTTAGQITAIKPTLLLDSAQLYDVVSKQLLEEQADVDQSGIQFSYKTYFNSAAVTSTNAVNIDIQQSASLVSQIIAVVRDNNKVSYAGAAGVADVFDFIQPFTQAQYRLGSLYWPQQQINVPTGANYTVTQVNSQEWYAISLQSFQAFVDEFHKAAGAASSIQFQSADVAASLSNNSWAQGKACLAFTGEKSACGLEMTGEPTNNSRILNFSGVIGQPAQTLGFPPTPLVGIQYTLTSVRVDTFLAYYRVCNLMGDNAVVDR